MYTPQSRRSFLQSLGDEEGFVLVMRRGRILNFDPASDAKAARVYATRVQLRGSTVATTGIDNFPY